MSQAQKVTVENVKATTQTLANGEFQLHFAFDLPDFDKAPASKINIVYAVLALEVEVLATDAKAHHLLEGLIAAENKIAPQANLPYNTYPVTARIRREKAGIELVEADITQVIDHWVHRGVTNNGLLLVSHRNIDDKTLRQDVVTLAPNARPVVAVFYTVNE
jgi:hypothetical protein